MLPRLLCRLYEEGRCRSVTKEFFQRLAKYRATMAAVRSMLRQGLISEEEYGEIDRIIAKKYGFDLSTIYR